MTPVPDVLRAAEEYARRGWAVVPIYGIRDGQCACGKSDCPSPGKHPIPKHGLKDATTDEKIIRRWWEAQWPDANVAIVTGRVSGLVVIDADGEAGCETPWLRRLPDTPEAATGGGGRHILFAHPGEGVRIGNRQGLAPGVDIRGDGGYIVAPPSLHRSGRRYEWDGMLHPDDVPLAPLPDWLLSRLVNGAPRSEPREPRADEGPPAPAEPMLTGCGWLRHCIADAATLGEQPWYAMLTIAGRLEDGAALAHQWSKPHPQYTPEETAEKLAHALRDTGPYTCATIRAELGGEPYCGACPHWGLIRSPIALGRGKAAALEPHAPPESASGRAEFAVVPVLPRSINETWRSRPGIPPVEVSTEEPDFFARPGRQPVRTPNLNHAQRAPGQPSRLPTAPDRRAA